MKNYWEEPKQKQINKKRILISILVAIAIIILLTIIILYNLNKDVRDWIDRNIFRKEVLQDRVNTIELKEEQNSNIHAFGKYIGILNKNQFTIYNNTGNKEKELEIQISNPIYNTASRFLAIAEKGGKQLYLIADKNIAWEATVEGNISQVYVNKNG